MWEYVDRVSAERLAGKGRLCYSSYDGGSATHRRSASAGTWAVRLRSSSGFVVSWLVALSRSLPFSKTRFPHL